jgi:putative lipoprotein
VGTRIFGCFALPTIFALLATQALGQTIQGTATFRERMVLPPAAVLEATIEDVSRADARASVVARTRVAPPGNPPIAFTIAYDQTKILPEHRYVVRVRILLNDTLLFTSDVATHWTFIRSYVIKDGHLFLALMADGGLYEFEPVIPAKP